MVGTRPVTLHSPRAKDPKRVGRTIIVGDVHGCASELQALLDNLRFTAGDRLVFVGDLVARGPSSLGVLDIARQTGAIIVRGNHEQKLLDWRRNKKAPISRLHVEVAESLRAVDWTLLETSPLWFDLPEHGARVVHAGVVPGTPIEEQDPIDLLFMRTIRVGRLGRVHHGGDSRADLRDDPSAVLWGELYGGPVHVVFGHNACPGLQLHPFATGLDTGCVYGGRLTAMVLPRGVKVPRSRSARQALLVSQPAERVHFGGSATHPARRKKVA